MRSFFYSSIIVLIVVLTVFVFMRRDNSEEQTADFFNPNFEISKEDGAVVIRNKNDETKEGSIKNSSQLKSNDIQKDIKTQEDTIDPKQDNQEKNQSQQGEIAGQQIDVTTTPIHTSTQTPVATPKSVSGGGGTGSSSSGSSSGSSGGSSSNNTNTDTTTIQSTADSFSANGTGTIFQVLFDGSENGRLEASTVVTAIFTYSPSGIEIQIKSNSGKNVKLTVNNVPANTYQYITVSGKYTYAQTSPQGTILLDVIDTPHTIRITNGVVHGSVPSGVTLDETIDLSDTSMDGVALNVLASVYVLAQNYHANLGNYEKVCSDSDVAEAIAIVNTYIGFYGHTVTCNDDVSGYAVSAYMDSKDVYGCVDSTGVLKGMESDIGDSTICD